jgi:hypothetical protein
MMIKEESPNSILFAARADEQEGTVLDNFQEEKSYGKCHRKNTVPVCCLHRDKGEKVRDAIKRP